MEMILHNLDDRRSLDNIENDGVYKDMVERCWIPENVSFFLELELFQCGVPIQYTFIGKVQ